MKFRKIISILLVLMMVLPMGMIHAAVPVRNDNAAWTIPASAEITPFESEADVTGVTYSHARVNATTRVVQVEVVDWRKETPLANATVKINGVEYKTGSNGTVMVTINDGANDLFFAAEGYPTEQFDGFVVPSEWPGIIMRMNKIRTVDFVVKDSATNQPLPGVTVSVNEDPYSTNEAGIAVVTTVELGNEITLSKPGYGFVTISSYDLTDAASYPFNLQPLNNADFIALIASAQATLLAAVEGTAVGQYEAGAKAVFQAAVAAAEHVRDTATNQNDINAARTALQAAITAFAGSVNQVGDNMGATVTLVVAIELLHSSTVGENVGEYPQAAKTALEAAVTAASVVMSNPATQAQIDAAQTTLKAAIATFSSSVNKQGSKGEANGVVAAADTLLDSSTVGENVGEYPQAAKTALEAAVTAARAVLDNPATQAQIDAAQATLQAAITTFASSVNKQGNKGETNGVVAAADTLLDNSTVGENVGEYPQAAKTALEAAVTAARAVLDNPATQAQIDAAQSALQAAISDFEDSVNKAGNDTEAAQTKVDDAEALLNNLAEEDKGDNVGQYPAKAVEALEAAINATKAVLGKPSTQPQINSARLALANAIEVFVNSANTEGHDKEAAQQTIANAKKLLKNAQVGIGIGQYPAEAITALTNAIAAANAVLEQPATQAQIDAARLALANAIEVFENSAHPEGHDKEEAQAAVTEATALIGKAVIGSGLGQYPAEAVQTLEAVIKATQDVLGKPSSQAEIDAAKLALTTAIAAFEASVIKPGDAEPIQTQIMSATALLEESTEGTNVGQYSIGSKATLQAAITKAEQVIAQPATQVDLDQALTDLKAAFSAFKAALRTSSVETVTSAPSGDVPSITQPNTKITDGLNTVETGQGTVKAAANAIQAIMKAAKPVVLESSLATIDFGKNSLNVTELKQALDAYLELGALLTEKSKTDEVLAGAKLEQAGMQALGGQVLDLIAQLNYSDGSSTRIKSFAEPVKVTINLKELGLSGSTDKLTAVRFVQQADGTYKIIKLGGVYVAATNSFEFYTDSFSLYSIVKADSVNKITFTINSTDYSIGALALKTDVPPVVQKERTLVPIRVVAEALGAEVKWDHATKTATITLGDKVLTMTLNQMIAGMDVPAQGIDGRIMVPLRYVSEALGAYVMWFPQEKRIEIIQ